MNTLNRECAAAERDGWLEKLTGITWNMSDKQKMTGT